MRYNRKNETANNGNSQLFGVDFHDFMQKQETSSSMELAQEFGLSLKDIRALKEKMMRS
ncbi:RNA polymerase subunit sigma-70 [Bacillus marinisedimentorum]|uniref:RNA polymerase subunit sigma-70 n=1 Tax=Bacillus marinisedimentorum TaxID=1821260 RepID=UPI000871EB38|nr:RNA polymerase subunit sigma-70 [Bacillus marinisedimentorum]